MTATTGKYPTLRDKIRAENAERRARYQEFEKIYQEAHEAGHRAATECLPAPMIVEQHANVLDDTSPVVQQWFASEGACGFAWINIRPATCSFARWLAKTKKCRAGYYGGIEIWVGDYGQSYERKSAYARAFASVLQQHGINAFAGGRLD